MGKRKGRCTRKNRALKDVPEPESVAKAPHSFVIHRGLPSKQALELMKDFRTIMEPYTATQLKERKNNSIKDFVSVAGLLHVSHLCIFSATNIGLYLKIARLPRGPTLTFKVHNFSFTKDVLSSIKKQYFLKKAFHNSPLIVMNSFSGEGMHLKLMTNMFQNMFPSINVSNVKLKDIRRCVLLNYNPDTKLIDFRHYYIKTLPVGLTKGTKKIVRGKVPDLSRCNEMSEFFEKAGLMSESEQEDDPNSHVVLPQNIGTRGTQQNEQSAIRLYELGPRLTLQLMKIEDGLLDGEVLFHEYIFKTEEEKEEIRKRREAKRKLKEKRKKIQEDNVKQKAEKKEEHKQKSLEGIKRKTETQRLMELAATESQRETGGIDDDDAEYYRQEVGEEPEHDLFTKPSDNKRKLKDDDTNVPRKKVRFNKEVEVNNKKAKTFSGGKEKNKYNSVDRHKKRSGGRGGNPIYGWRAKNSDESDKNNHENKSNHKKSKIGKKTQKHKKSKGRR